MGPITLWEHAGISPIFATSVKGHLLPKAAAGHSWGVGTLERGLPAPGAWGKPSPTTSSSSSGPRDKQELVDPLQL